MVGDGQGVVQAGITGLCFPELGPLQLLGFDPNRPAPEMEYDAFGHTFLPALWLVERGTQSGFWLRNSRVFALHSADDGEAHADDIDLEFWVDDDTAVQVSLSLFLECRAEALIGDAAALVLALCNPYRARICRPRAVTVPIFYAEGDVVAFMDVDEDDNDENDADVWSMDDVRIRLVADCWHEI